MPALARTAIGSLLDLWTGTPGILADAVAVSYQIWDISTDAKYDAPALLYPVPTHDVPNPRAWLLGPALTPGVVLDDPAGPNTLDPTMGAYVGTGHYTAAWQPASDLPAGRYRLQWFFQCTAGAVKPPQGWIVRDPTEPVDNTVLAEVTLAEEFDVIAGVRPLFGYCLPSDLRLEGLTTYDATDRRLVDTIRRATAMVENATGRHFDPREKRIQVDGNGEMAILLEEAIVFLELVELSPLFNDVPLEINEVDIRVYNRHVYAGLKSPDDRNNPKVELLRLGIWTTVWTTNNPPISAFVRWPVGVQNIGFRGVFGYTDRDVAGLSPVGETPELIRHACKLLCVREFPQMGDIDTREDRQQRHRLLGMGGRGQSVTLAKQPYGSYTGDPQVDRILESFRRPMSIGAA